jgi:hypothetical protein
MDVDVEDELGSLSAADLASIIRWNQAIASDINTSFGNILFMSSLGSSYTEFQLSNVSQKLPQVGVLSSASPFAHT